MLGKRSLLMRRLKIIKRAWYSQAALLNHVRVYHRSIHICMAKQFLYKADILPSFQQVRGERVATMSFKT